MCRKLVKMLHKASGIGTYYKDSAKTIRLVNRGCTNRPFFHIIVQEKFREVRDQVIEQVGSYDPMANERNERLVALNFERIQHWMGEGVHVSRPVSQLLGLCGFFPMPPQVYMKAWRNRKLAAANTETQQTKEEAS